MKKTFTLLIIVAASAIMGLSTAFAQPGTFFPNYFINQTFDGLEALPTGWTGVSSTSCFFGHAAASYVVGSGYTKVTATGSGTRGGEMRFPSTMTSNFKDSTVWVLEFDWTVNDADWDARQANGFFIMGPNSANVNVNDTWYGDVIFGLYCYKNPDGYIHYLNHDPIGLPKRDAGGAIIPGEFQGPVFYNQNGNNGKFTRQATAKTAWAVADSLNLSTRTKVHLTKASAFHIFAEMNFKTQKIQKLIMYEISNPANGDTIVNKDFLAPWMVGTATTVPLENRVVTQVDRMASFHTRSGGSANLNHSYDNWKLYVWKESVGIADVSVKYVDRSGNAIKDPRVMVNQQVNSTVWLALSDKINFTSNDGLYYYFYDAEATHAANAAKGADGESLTVDFSTTPGVDNSLTVVFKKVAITAGTYVWGGDSSGKWNYLDDNFRISGGAPMGYQMGNPVEFSKTDAVNKTVEVIGDIELHDGNMTVSAPDYIFTGTGKILGNGTIMVNAPTTLGADNRLVGGAVVQTSQPVLVKHANAAAKFSTTQPEITLGLEAGATFTKAIEGATGSTLNLNLVSLNEYAPAITGFSTVNIHQTTQTSLQSATWRTGWGGTMPENAQVNYINDVLDNLVPNGLGIVSTVMQKAKLHLGTHTRLVRQYNENSNNNDVVYVGELTGDVGSRIESGFVDGRYFRYDIGGLGTDAVFNGEIGAFTRTHVAATDTTAEVATYAANGVGITKSGSGSWTVNGNFNFPTGTKGSQVNVSGGKFIINGNILFPDRSLKTAVGSQINVTGTGLLDINGKVTFVSDSTAHVIKVANGTLQFHDSIIAPATNQITLTVDSAGVLKTGNNSIGASSVLINGIIEGGGKYANTFSLTSDDAILKLKVNGFDEGQYEFVDALGDISIKKGKIDITVSGTINGSKQITILKSGGNYDILDNMAFVKVLVNGQDITANTSETQVPEGGGIFYFDPETGVLGHLGTTGISDINSGKEVKRIEYFNFLGQKITQYQSGYVLKKITYTDDSVQTIKVLNKEKE